MNHNHPDFRIKDCTDDIIEHFKRVSPGGARLLISISGIPGSGKTTLANALVASLTQELGGPVAIALSMDGFHLPREALSKFKEPKEAFARRGAPWTFDPESLLEKLKLVKSNLDLEVTWPSFDHSIGDPVKDDVSILPSHRIVLVEGNYLLLDVEPWNRLRQLFDENWLLECSLETSEERLVARHVRTGVEPDIECSRVRVKGNDLLNAKLISEKCLKYDRLIPEAGQSA